MTLKTQSAVSGPYASIGVQLSSYTAKVNSAMGQLGTPSATFPKYLDPSRWSSFWIFERKQNCFLYRIKHWNTV